MPPGQRRAASSGLAAGSRASDRARSRGRGPRAACGAHPSTSSRRVRRRRLARSSETFTAAVGGPQHLGHVLHAQVGVVVEDDRRPLAGREAGERLGERARRLVQVVGGLDARCDAWRPRSLSEPRRRCGRRRARPSAPARAARRLAAGPARRPRPWRRPRWPRPPSMPAGCARGAGPARGTPPRCRRAGREASSVMSIHPYRDAGCPNGYRRPLRGTGEGPSAGAPAGRRTASNCSW